MEEKNIKVENKNFITELGDASKLTLGAYYWDWEGGTRYLHEYEYN